MIDGKIEISNLFRNISIYSQLLILINKKREEESEEGKGLTMNYEWEKIHSNGKGNLAIVETLLICEIHNNWYFKGGMNICENIYTVEFNKQYEREREIILIIYKKKILFIKGVNHFWCFYWKILKFSIEWKSFLLV